MPSGRKETFLSGGKKELAGYNKAMDNSAFIKFIRETIRESTRTQDRRLRSISNKITKSIMAIYDGRIAELDYEVIGREDLIVEPNSENPQIYEIQAGFFPIPFDPKSIDREVYDEGVDPTLVVVLEVDKNSEVFNVSASDKDITGSYDIGIHVAIETPADFSNSQKKMLRDEIANSVRHELEHITQGEQSDQPGRAFSRGEKYYKFLHSPESVESPYAKYLLKPEEIPAHVRGYAQNSKSIQQLKSSVIKLLDGYFKNDLITEEEKSIVEEAWIDWALNNINRKGYQNI